MSLEVEVSRRVRPFGFRAVVIPSPVDEEQRSTGLIVPTQLEDSAVERGVVAEICSEDEPLARVLNKMDLPVGTVVWFKRGAGWPVHDVRVLELDDIVAYEVDADG